jgi:proteasome alpha subunit
MYEEPYRWVEAVGNRRSYLDEQFKQGSPVVALSYEAGILLATVSKGTPKLYEIYDRIALGGMGHPADLEKLRFSLLEMAHTEGFNRSPSDVTGSRLVKYGVAPVIKQAFEEVYKAPFILKILLAELGQKPAKDALLTVNYDGTFEETAGCAVLAATTAVQKEMLSYLRQEGKSSLTLSEALALALRGWALGERAQRYASDQKEKGDATEPATGNLTGTEAAALSTHFVEGAAEKTIECAVLDRGQTGSSKYRIISADDLARLLPADLKPALSR